MDQELIKRIIAGASEKGQRESERSASYIEFGVWNDNVDNFTGALRNLRVEKLPALPVQAISRSGDS